MKQYINELLADGNTTVVSRGQANDINPKRYS